MKRFTLYVIVIAILIFQMGIRNKSVIAINRRPAPSPSRYGYTFEVDAKTLPKGVSVRTILAGTVTRVLIKNKSDVPLLINERFHLKRLVAGTKLVSGKVYSYFPSGVPMQGKRHLKGWQAPFGEIKETGLMLPKEPTKIYNGRKAGLSDALPPNESQTIPATYNGKPHVIKVTIKYHLNPQYDTHYKKD